MKKAVFIVALSGLFFASCKKDYTCTCTVTTNATGTNVTTTASGTTGKMKKDDAEAKCNEGDSSTSVGGITTTSACEISD
jgi:hypothetical protein